jgi:radical SAM superfamily enzyme YgiQ (UPF0313 family)
LQVKSDKEQRLDCIFVNPPSPDGYVYIRDINRSGRRSREGTIWPQTSLAYLAAVVKKEGYTAGLVDCIAEKMDWRAFEELLQKERPRYIVMNAITSIITNDLHTAELAKGIHAQSIAVGPHITALPQETLTRYPSLDIGIIGEAEETIRELINTLEKKDKPLSQVRGITFRDGGKVTVTEKRPLIENLDDLPIPLHELLPFEKHRLPYIGKRYTFVLSSRGCPYQCTFCRQPIMWERKFRSRSAGNILKELEYLKGLGITNFMFHSDTFTLDRKIVIELCQGMVDLNLNIRWCCNSRVDTVDEELLGWMKRAGCWMVMYGIESGSQEVLDKVKKGGSATIEQAKKAVVWTKQQGIKVWGYFIMGLPGETKETMRESVELAKSLPLDLVNFAVGAPYPGTEFFAQAKAEGWLESERWEDFDQNYSAIVSYPWLSSQEIIAGIRNAYLRWFLRPYGIKVFLKGLTSLDNLKMLFRVGLEHLKIGL